MTDISSGGVEATGVDWASKTFQSETFFEGPKSVSGSGYILNVNIFSPNGSYATLTIDGSETTFGARSIETGTDHFFQVSGPIRFNTSWEWSGTNSEEFIVNYVLD